MAIPRAETIDISVIPATPGFEYIGLSSNQYDAEKPEDIEAYPAIPILAWRVHTLGWPKEDKFYSNVDPIIFDSLAVKDYLIRVPSGRTILPGDSDYDSVAGAIAEMRRLVEERNSTV